MTDDDYWELVDHIKSLRPPCTEPTGHYFISYDSKGIQQCDQCGYTEKIIIKREDYFDEP